jgi:hypothetical protein
MPLTLANYATTISKELILLAKKNKVRECDETEKGHFVAYVDDGNESFDVSLTVKGGKEITAHTCECENASGLCRHKAALIIHLANGKKIKEVVKVKKKTGKAEALMDEVDPNALKEWVKGLIGKNKDIELSFIQHFSVKELLTPAEVAKLVNDAVKAVAGNKKTIDPTQLKKIVDLWSDTLAPVSSYYQANVTDEKAFLNFHEMLETCIAFQFKVDSASNKVPKFIEDNLQKSVAPVGGLQVEMAWDKAIDYFINRVPDGENRVRMHYLLHLQNITNISSGERQLRLIDRLAKQYEKSQPERLMNGNVYTKLIFEIINGHKLFAKYGHLFKPITFDNAYNQVLIRQLIDDNNLDLAKKYCREQIKQNFREEYNVLYLSFLKEIALLKKDEAELEHVLTLLFPFTFDFDDYLFVSKRLPDDERKKWRTKMLAKARNMTNSYGVIPAVFCFKLADAEKSYRKMIDYIDSYTPYFIILHYFENMFLAEKNKFLDAIISKPDRSSWIYNQAAEESDAACFPELFNLLEKHYTASYLKAVIINIEKGRLYYSHNKFVVYVKQRLLLGKK